ncbi:MAG TPA: pyridoxamine 5'-phosphate oxidase family protein [Ktedonobacterales bacterium]|nr:pyridoxamine 5'-phosphate oxidase family protein [Ktedonobacterales bacterium]
MQTQDHLDRATTTSATNASRTLLFGLVLRQLRRQHFAVLSTVGPSGQAQSAGVSFGVSAPGPPLTLYVMSRTHLQKARNVAQNPSVSLVVPLPRRLLWFLPPPTIHLRGRAELLAWTDAVGTAAFQQFWLGRRILAGYQAAAREGETRICFIKITPDPVISTYMVGTSLWRLLGDMEAGAGTARIPQ